MIKLQKYTNSKIACKAISIFLSHDHPFKVGYHRVGTFPPTIEFTFEYRFQGEIRTTTIRPIDTFSLMDICPLKNE